MSAQQIKSFVAEIYNTDTQVKRVLKEIDSLNSLDKASFKIQLTQFGLGFKIMVSVESKLFEHPSLLALKKYAPINFDVLLDSKFPFTHPKIVCKSQISQPSIADGRNITPDIIQAQWAPSILISKIILEIPSFLATLVSKQKDKLFLIHLGGFQVGDEYDLEQFLNINNVHVFSGLEHLQKGKPVNRYLIITESQFLCFGIVNAKDKIVLLERQYYLYEMQKIQKLQEKDSIAILALQFLVQTDEGDEQTTLTVQLKDSAIFIEAIQRSIQRLDLKQVFRRKIEIPEDEVTIKAYKSTDISSIEDSIAMVSSKLDESLVLSDINQLTELYQKAIEFYSANADDRFMTYMQSLKELLQREDVQMILQSKQESINEEKESQLKKNAEKEEQVRKAQQESKKIQDQGQKNTGHAEVAEEAKHDSSGAHKTEVNHNKNQVEAEEDSIFNDYQEHNNNDAKIENTAQVQSAPESDKQQAQESSSQEPSSEKETTSTSSDSQNHTEVSVVEREKEHTAADADVPAEQEAKTEEEGVKEENPQQQATETDDSKKDNNQEEKVEEVKENDNNDNNKIENQGEEKEEKEGKEDEKEEKEETKEKEGNEVKEEEKEEKSDDNITQKEGEQQEVANEDADKVDGENNGEDKQEENPNNEDAKEGEQENNEEGGDLANNENAESIQKDETAEDNKTKEDTTGKPASKKGSQKKPPGRSNKNKK